MSDQERLEKFWNKFKNASREEKKEMLRSAEKAVNKEERIKNIANSLLIASKEGNTEVVKNILESGFDPNNEGKLGNTPLHMVALGGHLEIVKLLIKNNADPSLENDRGTTALEAAELSNNEKVIAFLRQQSVT